MLQPIAQQENHLEPVQTPATPPDPPATTVQAAKAPLRIPWRRFLSQSLVIVVSILLAFAIDTWAAKRSERAQEQRYLALLFSEFTAARNDVVATGRIRTRARHASSALIRQVQGAATAPEDSLFWWMSGQSQQIEFNPATAALDDLISSGRIQLIRSDSLRLALAQYRPQLEQLRYADQQAWATWEQRIQPLLESRVPRVDRIRRGTWGAFETDVPFGPSRHDTDWPSVLSDRAVEDVLAERWLRLGVGQLRRDNLERHIDLTLRLIEQSRAPRV